jgi:hypothetical protein
LKYTASTSAPTGWTSTDLANWFNTAGYNNTILSTNAMVGYTAPFNYSNPDFTPVVGAAVLTGAYPYTDAKFNGLQAAAYRGAVGAGDNWYKGWTRYGN